MWEALGFIPHIMPRLVRISMFGFRSLKVQSPAVVDSENGPMEQFRFRVPSLVIESQ